METFSALLAFWADNSPVTSEFLAQRPVTRSYVDVVFHLCLNKRLSKQSWGWWFWDAIALIMKSLYWEITTVVHTLYTLASTKNNGNQTFLYLTLFHLNQPIITVLLSVIMLYVGCRTCSSFPIRQMIYQINTCAATKTTAHINCMVMLSYNAWYETMH